MTGSKISEISGMTLIELTVAMAIMGGLLLAVLQTTEYMNRAINYMSIRQELSDTASILSASLNSSACKNMIRGVTTNWVGALTTTPTGTGTVSLSEIDSPSSTNYIVKTGQMLNNGASQNWLVTSLKYESLTALPMWTDSSGSPTWLKASYTGNIVIELTNQASPSRSIGPSRFVRKIPLALSMKRDISSALNNPWIVTSCLVNSW